jgi:hypothetical protein
MLAAITDQPSVRWRLNHIAREAQQAATLVTQANRVLEAEKAKERIKVRSLEALAQVAAELGQSEAPGRIA